jgi:c-di-AMP phosphodiesterase-like protein
MANALEKIIEQSENVMIMGHSNPDADAIGAAIGLYRVAQCFNREVNIVIEDKENIAIREMMKHIENSGQYANVFVNHNEALNKMKNSNNEQEKAFYGAFIAHTQMELKEMGVDAFEYKII